MTAPPSTVVTVGNFDGVHLGHQKIIHATLSYAQDRRLHPVLITFDPHPSEVITGIAVKKLTTIERKNELIQAHGLRDIVCLPFDRSLSQVTANDFVEFLRASYGMRALIVGTNSHVGKNREGNPAFLRNLAASKGLDFSVVEPVMIDHVLVSSTAIRSFVLNGQVDAAASFLGRPHETVGRVVAGQGLGRQIGYPTLNIPASLNLSPKRGVYVCHVTLGRRMYEAVANVGVRPTLGQDLAEVVEVHVLESFEGDDGYPIRVHWLHRIRDEMRFESMGSLRSQIEQDVRFARAFFKDKKRPPIGYAK